MSEVRNTETLIRDSLSAFKELDESNVVSSILEYKPRNKEFSKLPPKVNVSLPAFHSKPLNGEQIDKMFGSLKLFKTIQDENGYSFKQFGGIHREVLGIPKEINTISTGYQSLIGVAVYSQQEIWTYAKMGEIKCFNSDGKRINTIITKSGTYPNDIAVTRYRDLLYIDWESNTVNKVSDGQTEEVIKLEGWTPLNLCVSFSDDFLVVFINDKETQSKLVRYSETSEKQTIQFDEEGKPLYSGNFKIKCLTESRNMDICLADYEAGAVVVVNQAGKLRFRYTGHRSEAQKNPFIPHGITTNSQSQILTADCNNHCIHV